MLILGITGGSGSGKTTLVNELSKQFAPDKISVLHADYYYRDNSHLSVEERKLLNFDHPDSIEFDLFYKDLLRLSQGQSIEAPTYNFLNSTRQKQSIRINPAPVIIVEGILIFSDKRIRDLCTVKAFIDASTEMRLQRIAQRDMQERGRTFAEVLERQEAVESMHQQFVEPVKQFADIFIAEGGKNQDTVNTLTALINANLRIA